MDRTFGPISVFVWVVMLLHGSAAFGQESTPSPQLMPPLKARMDLSLEAKKSKSKSLAVQYLRHGARMHSNGNVHIAETFFNKAINLDPDNPDGYYNLGALYEGRGDFELALKHYRLGLVASPGDQELKEAVDFLASRSKKDDIEQVLERKLPSHRPYQLQSDRSHLLAGAGSGSGVLPVAAPPTMPVLPVSQKPPGQSGARARAVAGALFRAGLNMGIRFAVRSVAGGCSGGLGF